MSRPRSLGFAVAGLGLCLLAPPGQPADLEPYSPRWESRATGRVRIDFGPPDRVAPGSEPCDARNYCPRAAWTQGMVRAFSREGSPDPFAGDGIEGESAMLLVAVEPGRRYRMVLTLGDAERARGPMRVNLDDRVLAQSLRTEAGKLVDLGFDLTPAATPVAIRIEADACESFAAAGLSLRPLGPSPLGGGRWVAPVGNDLPLLPARVDSLQERALRTLRAYANYLVTTQPPEGGFSPGGNWYECAYPIRTLLAASSRFGEARYRDAALDCLDRFVAERRPDGFWAAQYFGSRGCPPAMAMVEEGRSRNLADTGTLAACLPLALRFEEESRAGRDLVASRSYAEAIVLPAQLTSGAFPNGRYEGKDYAYPYSVATGVAACHLARLYSVTRDDRYRQAAVRAGLFLARTVEADGSVRFHPHDREAAVLLSADHMGELFYVLEGLLAAHEVAEGAARTSLGIALDRYVRGESLAPLWADPAAWLQRGDGWERSKRAGILFLLCSYRLARGTSPALDCLVLQIFSALENPRWATSLGVGAAPESPTARYAMVATGLAGIGVEMLLAPGDSAGAFPSDKGAENTAADR